MKDLMAVLRQYQDNKIAIYGLSRQTEAVLESLAGRFQVVCLLDGYRESGMLYGKPILSLQEAIRTGVTLIIVAARPSSCRVIVRRISGVCTENQVALLDMNGNPLPNLSRENYCLKGLDSLSKPQLKELIAEYETVSVDLFDTLVMRMVLFPSDIFDLVDQRLRQRGIYIEDFSRKRLDSEKSLAQDGAPNLTEIYAHMVAEHSVSGASPEELAELEWAVDYELIVPRETMCSLIREAYRQGKAVYIVSDTFYSRNQVAKLLERCQTESTAILVSCEYRTGKTQRLFEVLRGMIQEKNCLHLGDDSAADLEAPQRYGIAAYRIYSGIDLFEHMGYLGLWDCIGDLSSRIRLGMFVSQLLNSPFQIDASGQSHDFVAAQRIGFLFFAPLISDFVIWLRQQVEARQLQNVWFCARDGYLIKPLYDMLENRVSSIYFLTSRTAAVRAGVEGPSDIQEIAEMRFSGTLQAQLKERFGISGSDGELIDYADRIVSRAAAEKRNYQTYMATLDTRAGNIAFFDFVARGTVQKYISRLTDRHLCGFYFLRLEDKKKEAETLDITSFCKLEDNAGSAVFQNYSILEAILTSPEPMVKSFDVSGTPHYAEELRSEQALQCIRAVQDGIIDYFRTYLKICPMWAESINRNLDGKILSLIHRIPWLAPEFLALKVEDPFFNRTADIADLL